SAVRSPSRSPWSVTRANPAACSPSFSSCPEYTDRRNRKVRARPSRIRIHSFSTLVQSSTTSLPSTHTAPSASVLDPVGLEVRRPPFLADAVHHKRAPGLETRPDVPENVKGLLAHREEAERREEREHDIEGRRSPELPHVRLDELDAEVGQSSTLPRVV